MSKLKKNRRTLGFVGIFSVSGLLDYCNNRCNQKMRFVNSTFGKRKKIILIKKNKKLKEKGFHALMQHSRKHCHKKLSAFQFSNINRFAVTSQSTTNSSSNSETSTSSASIVEYELASQDKI